MMAHRKSKNRIKADENIDNDNKEGKDFQRWKSFFLWIDFE